jgi:hypothetical protein
MSGVFANRAAAGRALAAVLAKMRLHDPVVLALPRGGVPVTAEIAQRLEAPLDLVFVARIGVPFHQELAAAAVVDGKNAELVVNQQVRGLAKVAQSYLESEAKRQLAEIERRRGAYLQGRPTVPIRGRTAIVVGQPGRERVDAEHEQNCDGLGPVAKGSGQGSGATEQQHDRTLDLIDENTQRRDLRTRRQRVGREPEDGFVLGDTRGEIDLQLTQHGFGRNCVSFPDQARGPHWLWTGEAHH